MSGEDVDWGYVPPKDHGSLYVSAAIIPGTVPTSWCEHQCTVHVHPPPSTLFTMKNKKE